LQETGDAVRPGIRDIDGRQRVVFIGGLGRSGSTLLALLLNMLPGFVSVGELRYVWLYLHEDLLCSCGDPFRQCGFWQAVGDHAFGGWDRIDVEKMMRDLARVDRHRYMPWLANPGLSRSFDDRLRTYGSAIARIYDAIRLASGCDVVVDSTKEPPFAFVVRGIRELDLRVVHLVRESRGVAYSWMKWKRRPEVRDRAAYMDRYGPVSTSLRWLDCNLLMHNLVREKASGLLVKYEDLVERPRDVVAAVIRHGGEAVDPSLIDDVLAARIPAAENHSIAGNPIRFERGPVRLHLDDEWRSRMSQRDRILVSALTAPMLWRYGYLPARDTGPGLTDIAPVQECADGSVRLAP
jgi:hypothetical protein